MIKDLDRFGLVLLSCHSMAGSEFGAWNRTRHETRSWLRQDDTSTMGASDTIAAQYTRAGIQCQTAGNFHVRLRNCRPKRKAPHPWCTTRRSSSATWRGARTSLRVETHPADHGHGRGRGEPAPLGHTPQTPSVEFRKGPVRVPNYFQTTASA